MRTISFVKRDKVTAVIYYYTTTEFHYAKRDSPLSEFGGVNIEVSLYCSYTNIKISAKRKAKLG